MGEGVIVPPSKGVRVLPPTPTPLSNMTTIVPDGEGEGPKVPTDMGVFDAERVGLMSVELEDRVGAPLIVIVIKGVGLLKATLGVDEGEREKLGDCVMPPLVDSVGIRDEVEINDLVEKREAGDEIVGNSKGVEVPTTTVLEGVRVDPPPVAVTCEVLE